MERRNFLRNVVLGVAASLLPRILQPMNQDDFFEEVKAGYTVITIDEWTFYWHKYQNYVVANGNTEIKP